MDKEVVYGDKNNNEGSKQKRLLDRFEKLLTKKNLKIVLLIIVGVVAIVLFFGFNSNKANSTSNTVSSTNSYISTMDYCQIIENKLRHKIKRWCRSNFKEMILMNIWKEAKKSTFFAGPVTKSPLNFRKMVIF